MWWSESHVQSNTRSRGAYLGCDTLEALYTPSSASTTGSVPRMLLRSIVAAPISYCRAEKSTWPASAARFFVRVVQRRRARDAGQAKRPSPREGCLRLGSGCLASWLVLRVCLAGISLILRRVRAAGRLRGAMQRDSECSLQKYAAIEMRCRSRILPCSAPTGNLADGERCVG